jgi:hypothetical protein
MPPQISGTINGCNTLYVSRTIVRSKAASSTRRNQGEVGNSESMNVLDFSACGEDEGLNRTLSLSGATASLSLATYGLHLSILMHKLA